MDRTDTPVQAFFPRRTRHGVAGVLLTALFAVSALAGEARVWYVAPGGAGDGRDPARPFGRLEEAVNAADAGDRIVLAHGQYTGSVEVEKPGLTITAADPLPSGTTPAVVITADKGPTLVNYYDTQWRGVGFVSAAAGQDTARLENFTGRFERCSFSAISAPGADYGRILIRIHGGRPQFHACVITGAGGGRIGARITDFDPLARVNTALAEGGDEQAAARAASATKVVGPALAQFTYCFFSDLNTAAVLLSATPDHETAGVRVVNSLMARCGPAVVREPNARGPAEVVNSVLFLVHGGLAATVLRGLPPVKFSHCLYTPGPGDFLGFRMEDWRLEGLMEDTDAESLSVEPFDKQPGLEREACLTGSPRFVAGRHPMKINFTIDDTRHGPVAQALSRQADRFGYPVSWAINTYTANDAAWEIGREMLARGHEIASHTTSHSPMAARPPLRVGYAPEGSRQALLSIAPDPANAPAKRLTIAVDGHTSVDLPLAAKPTLTISGLAAALNRLGVSAAVGTGMRDVPAWTLENHSNVDVHLPGPYVPLGLDVDVYLDNELRSSRELISERIGRPCTALVYPYSSYTPRLRDAVVRAGYTAARGGTGRLYPRTIEGASRYHLNGYTMLNAFRVTNLTRWQDVVEILLDLARDSGAPLTIFSHGEDEFTLKQWDELFGLVKGRADAKPQRLAELGRFVIEEQARLGKTNVDDFGAGMGGETEGSPGLVEYRRPAVEADLSIYRPAPDSPLVGAGKPMDLPTDFAGRPIPAGAKPNIGLFQ